MTELLPGVRSYELDTDRVRMHVLESGPEDGIPVVLIHGNLSTGRFFEHLMPAAPERYRDRGGRVEAEWFEGSGHGPMFDASDRFRERFFTFVASAS